MTHFAQPADSGWLRLRDIYGRLGTGIWNWAYGGANGDGTVFEITGSGFVVPCFAAGTRLATAHGATAVEDLAVGDLVHVRFAGLTPIKRIGRSRVDCRRHPRPESVWPICVVAGAFGVGLPARDRFLSPDHAVYAEGVLIPVKHLVNGATITQERREHVTYFHVELAQHDILLAEGLPAESYLDTCNRDQFANGGEAVALHPDFGAKSWDNACAPLRTEGDELLAVRRRLLARVEELGYRRSDAPDLQVVAGNRVLRVAAVKGRLHRFLMPAGAGSARIVSRRGIPAGHDLAATDDRWLGACIGGISAGGRLIPLDSSALGAGFYGLESNGRDCWRWTNGAAELSLPAEHAAPFVLEFLMQDTMHNWKQPVQESPERRVVAA